MTKVEARENWVLKSLTKEKSREKKYINKGIPLDPKKADE